MLAVAAAVALSAWAPAGCARPRGPVSADGTAARDAALRAAATPAHADHFVTPAQFEKAMDGAGAVAADLATAAEGNPGVVKGDAGAAEGDPGTAERDPGAADRDSDADSADARIVAAVVPHHLVAGHLVAGLFAYLSADPPRTLVVVGPDHHNAGPRVGTSLASWRTGPGLVDVDVPLTAALIDRSLAGEAWAVQDEEHSVGVLMPFARRYLPETRVVALTLRSDVPFAEACALGRFLREWAATGAGEEARGGRGVFVVASVDFSHYLPRPEAERRDSTTLPALERGDWTALFGMGPSNLDSPAALAVAFVFAGDPDSPDFVVVEHTNSATLLGQPDLPSTTSHFLFAIRGLPGS